MFLYFYMRKRIHVRESCKYLCLFLAVHLIFSPVLQGVHRFVDHHQVPRQADAASEILLESHGCEDCPLCRFEFVVYIPSDDPDPEGPAPPAPEWHPGFPVRFAGFFNGCYISLRAPPSEA